MAGGSGTGYSIYCHYTFCDLDIHHIVFVLMVLGRLVHYTVDAVLLSTVVAGVRRSSGFSSVFKFFSDVQLLE